VWVPKVRAAVDPRTSIADTLATTLATQNADAAVQHYRDLKTSTSAPAYNFDEKELNTLGYQLLAKHRYTDAIRILQLNVENFPQSSNVYDSLGEAYADAGDKPHAIQLYRHSLQLNPKNTGAVLMLKKLGAP
jgi:tetratricopeptide (TPR) repeat protein